MREDSTTIRLPKEIHRALKVYAVERDRKLTSVLVQIIIDFLAAEAKKKVAGGK